jgi:hypothetical protein
MPRLADAIVAAIGSSGKLPVQSKLTDHPVQSPCKVTASTGADRRRSQDKPGSVRQLQSSLGLDNRYAMETRGEIDVMCVKVIASTSLSN